MKQIEVTILGHSYILGCPEGGEASLLEAVNLVDHEMSTIRDAGKVKARERIAVLAALNLAFQLAEDTSATVVQRPAPPPGPAAVGPSDEEVTALIRRIDQTLNTDGQLI
ncbi:MAG: cell division protein ZapA [Pseudomonadota bacterium]